MIKHRLIPHPDYATPSISIGVKVRMVGSDVLRLEYAVVGQVGDVRIPNAVLPARRDELWQATCFEMFAGHEGQSGYAEFNFSPNRQYASYWFDRYRDGMQPAYDLPAPDIFLEVTANRATLVAWLDARKLSPFAQACLAYTAVIEANDGTKSYWALAHGAGPPDFHNPDCFVAHLPAPERP